MLFVLYALVAPLVLFAASYVASILAPRAFLIFVPYLLIMASAGLGAWPGSGFWRLAWGSLWLRPLR